MTNEPTLWQRRGVLAGAVVATVAPAAGLAVVFGVSVSEVWAHHLLSDRLLFAGGGGRLVETVRLSLPFWRGVGTLALPTLAGLVFLSLFVWSAVLDSLCHGDRLRPRDVATSATLHVGNFAALYGIFLLARGAVALFTATLMTAVAPAVARDASERSKSFAVLAAALVGVVLLELLRLLHDLSTAAVVRHQDTLGASLLTALDVFRERLPALVLRRLGYTAGFLGLLVGTLWLGTTLWESTSALLARTCLHLAAIAAAIVLRAGWLRGMLCEVASHELPPRALDEPLEPRQGTGGEPSDL